MDSHTGNANKIILRFYLSKGGELLVLPSSRPSANFGPQNAQKRGILGPFWGFLGLYGEFRAFFGLFCSSLDLFGSIQLLFGPIQGPFWEIRAWFGGNIGPIIFEGSEPSSGAILCQFERSEPIGPIWEVRAWFGDHFGPIWGIRAWLGGDWLERRTLLGFLKISLQ